jgi:hypothetical protein
MLDSLGSPDSARAYAFAMNDFIAWYCSEPRLAFSKHVVLRYRIELESRHLSASTINLRLAAVRRLAFEAAESVLSGRVARRAMTIRITSCRCTCARRDTKIIILRGNY